MENTQLGPIPLSFNKQPVIAVNDGEESGLKVAGDDGQSESVAAPSEDGKTDASGPAEEKTVSVSHILTNAIVLQSFLFELASLIQVRAGLFDEVRFT